MERGSRVERLVRLRALVVVEELPGEEDAIVVKGPVWVP